nr:hypothetical protein [Faecalibaculum rodentium]
MDESCELFLRYRDRTGGFDTPFETAFVYALEHQPVTRTIAIKDLDEVSAAAGKYEKSVFIGVHLKK